MARALLHSAGLAALLLVACSKSPKQQLMAGFSDSCRAAPIPEVTSYCNCMVKNLDAAFPAKLFNDPDLDPSAVSEAFGAMAIKLAPACKAQVTGSPQDTAPQPMPAEQTPTTSAAPTATPSDAWKAIQAQIKDNPKAYIDQCVGNRMSSAQSLGGATSADAESNKPGYQGACAKELFELQNCVALNAAESERCYQNVIGDQE